MTAWYDIVIQAIQCGELSLVASIEFANRGFAAYNAAASVSAMKLGFG